MTVITWIRLQADRVVAGVIIGLGAVALILGYLGAADTAYPAEQVPYLISGGIGGLFLLGLGATLLLSADLRDDWRKLDRIEEELALGRASGQSDGRDEAVALHAVRYGNG
jgi:hypothetical protein